MGMSVIAFYIGLLSQHKTENLGECWGGCQGSSSITFHRGPCSLALTLGPDLKTRLHYNGLLWISIWCLPIRRGVIRRRQSNNSWADSRRVKHQVLLGVTGPARPSRWPRSSRDSTARHSFWRTTRRLPHSCFRSSEVSFQTTPWSTSSATMTITSLKLHRGPTPISKRNRSISTACGSLHTFALREA